MAGKQSKNIKKSPSAPKAPKHSKKRTNKKVVDESDMLIADGKTRMTVRFDTDVVDWFKAQGPKFQTRMNQVLRRFMEKSSSGEVDTEHASNLNLEIQATANRNMGEYLFALNRLGDYWLSREKGEKAAEYFEQAANAFKNQKN